MKIRFLPCASALLIAWTLSEGFATKKSSIGIEWPGVGPLCQVVPLPSRCASGTKTLQWLLPSTVRNGFSRDSGFVSSVV